MRRVADNVVELDDRRFATASLAPGQRVYGEDILHFDGAEWRVWDPTRSKLGSYLVKGGRNFPLREDSKVLYLGAANGTTPSHVSDIVARGVLVAVEFSPRSFRDLLRVAAPRENMVPILADAWRPELYERYLGKVDLVFQDIAQRQQAAIFAKNVNAFRPPMAMLAIKARSVDVAANPRDVYVNVAREVEELTGYDAIETVDLGPFEKDHAAVVFTPGDGKRAPREERAPQREREERPRDERPRDERPRFERRDDRPRDDRGPKKWGPKPQSRGPPTGGFEKRQKFDKRGPPPGGRPDRRGWR